MKSIEYNKLIRDRILEIIEKSGKEPIYRIAEGDELLDLLNAKLYEELNKNIIEKLTQKEIHWIVEHCDEKLKEYYGEEEVG